MLVRPGVERLKYGGSVFGLLEDTHRCSVARTPDNGEGLTAVWRGLWRTNGHNVRGKHQHRAEICKKESKINKKMSHVLYD